MLPVHFLEALGGGDRLLLLIQEVEALVVELVRRLIDRGLFLAEDLVPGAAHRAARAERHGQHQQRRAEPKLAPHNLC